MNNQIASKWNILYVSPEQCDIAISELNLEANRLNEEYISMRKIQQEYETNVIPHLSEALSQMNGEVATTIKNAKELLAENYKGATTGVRETKDNLNKSNASINSAKNKIKNLQTIVKANKAYINELINKCNQEKGEVKAVRAKAVEAKYTYLNFKEK